MSKTLPFWLIAACLVVLYAACRAGTGPCLTAAVVLPGIPPAL